MSVAGTEIRGVNTMAASVAMPGTDSPTFHDFSQAAGSHFDIGEQRLEQARLLTVWSIQDSGANLDQVEAALQTTDLSSLNDIRAGVSLGRISDEEIQGPTYAPLGQIMTGFGSESQAAAFISHPDSNLGCAVCQDGTEYRVGLDLSPGAIAEYHQKGIVGQGLWDARDRLKEVGGNPFNDQFQGAVTDFILSLNDHGPIIKQGGKALDLAESLIESMKLSVRVNFPDLPTDEELKARSNRGEFKALTVSLDMRLSGSQFRDITGGSKTVNPHMDTGRGTRFGVGIGDTEPASDPDPEKAGSAFYPDTAFRRVRQDSFQQKITLTQVGGQSVYNWGLLGQEGGVDTEIQRILGEGFLASRVNVGVAQPFWFRQSGIIVPNTPQISEKNDQLALFHHGPGYDCARLMFFAGPTGLAFSTYGA